MARFTKAPAVALMALLLGACLAACGQPAQAPVASPTAEVGRLSVAWVNPPSNYDDAGWKGRTAESLAYLGRLLRGRGWEVDISLAGDPGADGSLPDAVEIVKAAVAAGMASDGYIVTDAEAAALLEVGLAQDPRGVLPAAAPALYDRYRKIIDGGAAGLPLATNLFDGGTPTVLYLEKAAAEKVGVDIRAMSDVLTFLEQSPGTLIGVASLYRSTSVLEAWAAEQGYYAPDTRAFRGHVYARFGDPKCMLVPIEDIPGFDAFYPRWFALERAGRFVDTNLTGMLEAPAIAGFVGSLTNGMDHGFLQSHGRAGADYLAFPLAGCATAAEALDPPRASRQLALTASGQKAEKLCQFIEWALLDQKNYQLLRYGAQGVDWRLTDGRLEYLNYRQPLGPADWQGDTKAYFKNSFCPFYDASMELVTAWAPANYAEARAACRPASRPLSAVADGSELYQYAALSRARGQLWQVTTQREQLLSGLVLRDRGGIGDYAAECLAQLRGIHADTDRMIAAYQGCIDEILAGAAQESDAGGK